jgi:hypothetical protein
MQVPSQLAPETEGVTWLRRTVRYLDPGAPRWILIPLCLLTIGLIVFQGTTVPALLFGEHDWRQADTFSVAFWFRHLSADFFHPQIDWGSERSGVMGMEAPIFPYAIYLLSYVLGDQPYVGRLLNWLLFWPIAFIFARRFSRSRAGSALMTLAFATSPMGLYEFRQVQPDPFMTSFIALSCIAFDRSASEAKRSGRWLVLGYAAATMAVLSKVPAVVALPALLVLAVGSGRVLTKRSLLLALGFLPPVALAVAWDRWAHHLNVAYNGGVAYFHIDFSLALIWKSLTRVDVVFRTFLWREFPAYVMSWVWTPAFLAGLPLAFLHGVRRHALAMLTWLVAALLFCACVSDRLVAHWYYAIIAFVPASYFICQGLENVIELWRGNRASSSLSRAFGWAVLLALLLTPVVGGRLKDGNHVPGSGSAKIPWATWCVDWGPALLAVSFATGFALASATRWWSHKRLLGVTVAVAFASASSRGAYDGVQALLFRGQLRQRTAIERSIRQLQAAADALIPLRSRILVDMKSPAYLRRARRHGFAVALKIVNKQSLGSFARRGAMFFVHFGHGPPPKGASQKIASGDDWTMYCLSPTGCRGPDGVLRSSRPTAPEAPDAGAATEESHPGSALTLTDAGAGHASPVDAATHPEKPESPETPESPTETPEGKTP